MKNVSPYIMIFGLLVLLYSAIGSMALDETDPGTIMLEVPGPETGWVKSPDENLEMQWNLIIVD